MSKTAARATLCVLAGVLALTLASCTATSDTAATSSAPAPPSTTTPRSTAAAPAGPACAYTPFGVPMPNPQAPAYTGPGPHLAVVEYGADANSSPLSLPPNAFEIANLPPEWQAPANESHGSTGGIEPRTDPAKTELVVCLTAARPTSTTPAGTCRLYEVDIPYTFDVYPVAYDFTVYEARTGQSLAAFSIPGDDTAGESCPMHASVVGSEHFGLHIKPATFTERVRELITRTR